MNNNNSKIKPRLGLALSGSGNRSTFYIGFLEVLQEDNIEPDFISATSGGSLVAAAYACGNLQELKKLALSLNKEKMRSFFVRAKNGGYYSLDLLEEEIKKFTNGRTFEEVRPHMAFIAVDIDTGVQVNLCMGDIARAARISCTLPGVFEPVSWGGRPLVDGGLLTIMPSDVLKEAGMDIIVGVNMRGTKHIFSDRLINAKKVLNYFKKILFVDELEGMVNNLLKREEDSNALKEPGLFSVLGRSLDLAIEANKKENKEAECDLFIRPNMSIVDRDDMSLETFHSFYLLGRETAKEYVPKINELIAAKTKVLEKSASQV
jgi:predicted acylesterase/phospholipase RssA